MENKSNRSVPLLTSNFAKLRQVSFYAQMSLSEVSTSLQ